MSGRMKVLPWALRLPLGRVASEDEIASLDWIVAGEAGLHLCFGRRHAVLVELRVSPASGRGVFLRVLDHEREVPLGRVPGDEGLLSAEDLVVLLRRHVLPGDPGDDRAVREWKRLVPVGLDRDVVAQNR